MARLRWSLSLLLVLALLLVAGACGPGPDNRPPDIAEIADREAVRGDVVSVPFGVADESPDTLSITARSDDQTLVSDSDLAVTGGGADRTLDVTLDSPGIGTAKITVTAEDREGATDSEGFELTVLEVIRTPFPKLTAGEDAAEEAVFGFSVAVSGDYAVVGARLKDEGEDKEDAGAAYVFRRTGGGWPQVSKLTASDGEANDQFGFSVAVDGDYAVVGAAGNDEPATDAGAAYVFR